MTIFRFSVLAPSIICLASCTSDAPNPRICNEAPALPVEIVGGAAKQVDAAKVCIKRWAFRLAKSQGSTSQIARSVMVACAPDIDRTTAASLPELPAGYVLINPGNLKVSYVEQFERVALFRVTQARAGHCDAQ